MSTSSTSTKRAANDSVNMHPPSPVSKKKQKGAIKKESTESKVAEIAKGFGGKKKTKSSQPIIKKMEQAIKEGRAFYSFEYFPPKTNAGVNNLFSRMERMSALEPMFMDVTWGAGGSTAQLTLEISSAAQNFCSSEVMMHLTCTNLPKKEIKRALQLAQKSGIRNILALRGDPSQGDESWEQAEGGFALAADLVKFIREEFGDFFGVAVAGYPEGHVSATSLEDDIMHLKAKVDAGADFVITQLFYDVDKFVEWMKKCRAVGITCPIIPGIMPVQNYNGFKRMTAFCKTNVPADILSALEPIKHDDSRVKAYGIDLGIRMCRKLLNAGVQGLHFYTLNLERSVTRILEGLGYVTPQKAGELPWKQAVVSRRKHENVRPIFWANRPDVYADRTANWDEYPNGRWGDSSSPAFGDLSDYHLCSFKTGKTSGRRRIWGEAPIKPKDVYDVFARYIEGRVPRLPWCENQVQLETVPLKESLKRMNASGYLTINSQPKANGVPSTDFAVGWGGPGGYVYQKAYLEFFTSQSNLEKLTKLADEEYPSMTYTAVDVKGACVTNHKVYELNNPVNAVTWGVFPGREIVQPTVVDAQSFMVWKDEAFALWKSQWQTIYKPDSESFRLIQEIHDTYYLVNIVDNDYVNGDIFAFFKKLCD